MSEDLIGSVYEMIRTSRGGVQRLNYALNILKEEGSLLFLPVQNVQLQQDIKSIQDNKKKTIVQSASEQEKILKIIDDFIDEFESRSLPHGTSVKNYLVFLVIILKILRKLKENHQRSLYAAHALSRVNQMFSRYPLNYKRHATRDPLGLLFVITMLVQEAGRGLDFPYNLDDTTSYQFVPLVTKYCMDSENPLREIIFDISKMPKFRLAVIMEKSHNETIGKIFGYCMPKIPTKIRLDRATKIFEKIIMEKSDSAALECYNTLRLFYENDSDTRIHLSKIARQEISKNHRMFVKGIIEEIARLGP